GVAGGPARGDAAALLPTATGATQPADHPAAGHVTAGEIAEFLRHLTELRGARGGDPTERAAFGHRKAELFARLAADPSTPTMTTPIIDNNALTAALRALKLGGMLQTLDARLAQARAGELGHLEFLQVLCHDEISRRETTAIARRTRRARFEETLTLEGFDFTAAPKLPVAQIRDLAALRRLQAGESVILYGPVVINGS
ncbi:MAG TPA: ATP-binding protein, partial [Pseudonocardia sp.]|nr:ATP-binding protein [Pseudonocardia sp.]